MKILIACEESQRVCIEFRARGHEAYSCDIVKCSGGHPEWHILDNALSVLNGGAMKLQNGKWIEVYKWDLIIAHPPCTYLSSVNTSGHSLKKTPVNRIIGTTLERINAMSFFMTCVQANCDKIAVENPVGIMNSAYRQPDQIIDPWMFAESTEDVENYVNKKTCLWIKGLPQLKVNGLKKPNNALLHGRYASGEAKTWVDLRRRSMDRSKTFPAVAKAMAEQWG